MEPAELWPDAVVAVVSCLALSFLAASAAEASAQCHSPPPGVGDREVGMVQEKPSTSWATGVKGGFSRRLPERGPQGGGTRSQGEGK